MDGFTNIKDLNLLILLQAPDEVLPKIFCLNKYFMNIYNDPNFWRLKIISRFKVSLEDLNRIEKFLGEPKDAYFYLVKPYMDTIIPLLKDDSIMNEIENIMKKLLPAKLPKWLNAKLYMFEFRRALLKKIFIFGSLHSQDNNLIFFTDDIWSLSNPFNGLGDPWRDHIIVSKHISNVYSLTIRNINIRRSKDPNQNGIPIINL